MSKRTEQEIRAAYAAKIAKIDARETARNARKASKEVRAIERDLSVIERYERESPSAYIYGIAEDMRQALKRARAEAVNVKEPAP